MTFFMDPITPGAARGASTRSLIHRVATLTAASGLILGLAACGGDDDDAGSGGNSGSSAFDAVKEKAAGLDYTCLELKDNVDEVSGLAGGLSCVSSAEPLGSHPTFVVFPTSTMASGEEVAEQAVATSGGDGGLMASLDEDIIRGTFHPVDGDGVAGYCMDTSADGCATMMPQLGFTTSTLDGSRNIYQEQSDSQAQLDREAEERRAAESAAAQATEEAQKYTGWKDADAAVEQLAAWGLRCEEPETEDGFTGTFCGDSDGPLFFGDYDDVIAKLKKETGLTDDQAGQMLRVTDDNWTMLCFPDRPENCDTVAEKTGKDVKEGL